MAVTPHSARPAGVQCGFQVQVRQGCMQQLLGRVSAAVPIHACLPCRPFAAGSIVPRAATGTGSNSSSSDSNNSSRKGPLDFGSPLRRCTDSLLVLNGLMFLLQWASKDALMLWGAKVNSLVAAGQWWRLLTSSFLHTSAFHLLINSHALATIGPHAELLAGRQRFMAVYFTSAVVGTTASYLLTPSPSVGASAALFGLGASLGMFYWRHRDSMGRRSEAMLQQLGLTLAINMAYSLASRRIDNWGHIGGLIGGAVVSWLLGPRLVRAANGRTLDQPPLSVMAYKARVFDNYKPLT
eukprot:GHRR01025163.1.p1 GENE.GHRR01025163.1~~GHRR01025163.1.p1  ORF type:complete len:296 (+),score=107.40 GHRR01025163.1:713-1600(+)